MPIRTVLQFINVVIKVLTIISKKNGRTKYFSAPKFRYFPYNSYEQLIFGKLQQR